MSTSAVQATPSPAWKQEVNRRLAAHKSRKCASQVEPPIPVEAESAATRRAQEARARVAARFAKAPSYSDLLAVEPRAALRAAEADSHAFEAQVASRSVSTAEFEGFLDDWHGSTGAAQAAEPALDSVIAPAPEPAPIIEQVDPVSVRRSPDLSVRSSDRAPIHASRGHTRFEDEWDPASAEPAAPGAGDVEMVEPAQPIQGNVIEFPRELVAPRKARPRLAEASSAAVEATMQLSIFEVDPAILPAQPELETVEPAAQARTAPDLTAPTWSGLELDAQAAPAAEPVAEQAIAAAAAAPGLQPATVSRRLMAAMVDAALMSLSVLGAAMMTLHNARMAPGVRPAEIGLGAALLLAAALYYALFFGLSRATPGMKYARIRLSTFEGQMPNRAQRCGRSIAMLLAVMSMGLGVAWAAVDDDGLCWHDRLSRTYLREA